MTMLDDLRDVVQACADAKGHAPLSDTELTLRLFVKRHAAQIEQDARDAEVLRHERDNARIHVERLAKVLVGIHALLYPAPQEIDGKRYVFSPPLDSANEWMQALSDRIRSIPDEVDAAMAKESGK